MRHVRYLPPWPDGGRPAAVAISYSFEAGTHTLQISEMPATAWQPDPEEWDRTSQGGREMLLMKPGPRLPLHHLAVDAGGTWVLISSDLEREMLLEIAASLEPAPTGPPRFEDAPA